MIVNQYPLLNAFAYTTDYLVNALKAFEQMEKIPSPEKLLQYSINYPRSKFLYVSQYGSWTYLYSLGYMEHTI